MGMRRSASLREIERLYRTRLGDFVRVAAAITGSVESGQDAVHDGFVAAVKGRRRYRGVGTIEAWVWRAVVTSALKARRRRPQPGSGDVADVPSPNGTGDEYAEIRALVALLPDRQRFILFLRYYADLDYGAIATALDLSPGTVGATLHAAHATLRERLQEVPSHE
jgi:RNA polymerase sigma factor (sigma-70 family)